MSVEQAAYDEYAKYLKKRKPQLSLTII